MSTLALLILTLACARAEQIFKVTKLFVPQFVPEVIHDIEIECFYEANFTVLNWFKGQKEFFRYQPGKVPTTIAYNTEGVGTLEIIECGPDSCKLKLGQITEAASGLYRCDLERTIPPYNFDTMSAYMHVHGHKKKLPEVKGLAAEIADGEKIEAYCRAEPSAEIRWYLNSHELKDIRGSRTLDIVAVPSHFIAVPPRVTVQCAEFIHGKIYTSSKAIARWKVMVTTEKTPEKKCLNKGPMEIQRNYSERNRSFAILSIFVGLSLTFMN